MSDTHVPVSTLRLGLKRAKARFNVTPNYESALWLQKKLRELEAFFKDERKYWFVLDGDGISDPNHIPPTHWRVIDGGKS